MNITYNFKKLTQALLTTSVVCAMSLSAFAQNKAGTNSGGGGDPTEIKFKEVAQNIKDWIMVGNSASLQLPPNLTLQKYDGAMLTVLQNYNITMTTNKVTFDNQEKTCKSEFKKKLGQITCNIPRFLLAEKDPKQLYQLVHHELATLAGVEIAKGAVSDYEISNQITSLLAAETVYRLPVVRTDLNQNNGEYGFIVWPEVVDQNMTTLQYCPTTEIDGAVTVSDKCLSVQKDLQGVSFNTKSRYNHPVRPGIYKLLSNSEILVSIREGGIPVNPLVIQFEVKQNASTALPASRLILGGAAGSDNLGSSNYQLVFDITDPSVKRKVLADLTSPNLSLIYTLSIPSLKNPESFNSEGAYYYQLCRFVLKEKQFSNDKVEICKRAMNTMQMSDDSFYTLITEISGNGIKFLPLYTRYDFYSGFYLSDPIEKDKSAYLKNLQNIQEEINGARSIITSYTKRKTKALTSDIDMDIYEVYRQTKLELKQSEFYAFKNLTNGTSALVLPGNYKLTIRNESGDTINRDVTINSPETNF